MVLKSRNGQFFKVRRLFVEGSREPFFDGRELPWDTYLKEAGSGRVGLCWGKARASESYRNST